MDKYTGKRLDGRYEIYELIGVGGMALVYRAHDTIDDRTVAIKILKDEYLTNQDFIRRFKNESKAIAVLSHPNIVKVFDVSFGDRIQYIVEEYIDGITLREYLDQQQEVKWKEAIHFTVQILRALQHAHEKGIVHRDIKPQNIMLLQDGTIKVTDFGIARFSRSETRTMTDKAIGSVHYIAPEQARGDLTDEKSDLYSVGVMLYEMITGQLPFEADNAVSVAIMQLQADPKLPRTINPSIPDGLEEITMKAMQKDPRQRYQSAGEMLQDIEAFRRNPSISFQYKYFVDEKPTKYVDAINTVRGSELSPYNDNYEYEYEEDAQSAPPKKKSPAPMILVGIFAAFLIVAISIGIAALFRGCSVNTAEEIEMPDLLGKNYVTEVENNDQYKDFKFIVEYKEDTSKDAGTILSQKPTAGLKVKKGAEVTLTVNSEPDAVTIPDVANVIAEDAQKMLEELGLKVDVQEVVDAETEKGYARSTDPKSGSKLAKGETVKLFISKGDEAEEIKVPNVIGSKLEDAQNKITDAGLTVGDVTTRDDSGQPEGIVLETNPLNGVAVTKGSKVSIVVSSGKQSEKTLEAIVHLPSNITHDIRLKAYLDGTVMEDGAKTVNPSYNNLTTISAKGSSGTKTLVVELDGSKYSVFILDFDSGKVSNTETYPYVEPNSGSTAPTGGVQPSVR